MSVLLEGTIPENEDDLEWNGDWQFVRDRSAKVQFNYKWKSCDIPNDLINYVSFRGGTTSAETTAARPGPGPGSGKSRKRGRGGSKKTEDSANDMDISATVEEEENGGQDDSDSDSGTTPIKRTHPLFGYYEGTFDVKSGVGSADTAVPESLFIYSMAAQPSPAEVDSDEPLDDSVDDNRVILSHSGHAMPPEQIFSYSVMKILKEEFSGSQEPMKDRRMYKAALHNASARAAASATATAAAAAAVLASSSGAPVVDLSGEGSTTAPGALSVDPEAGPSSSNPKFVDCAAVQADTLPDHFTLVLGFGRNMFGRFALVGAFNEESRVFVCEKRYMVSKHTGVNRYRMPIVATARYADEGEEGEEGPGSGRRKRTSTNRLHFDEMDSPAKEPSVGASTPVSEGGSTPVGTGVVPVLTGKGHRKYARKDKAAKEGKEGKVHGNCKAHRERHGGLTQAQLQKQNELRAVYDRHLPDDIHLGSAPDMVANGLADSSGNVVSTYRSAYLDPDTGDIYEGGWVDGFRHGRGVCLYALPSVLVETKDQEISRSTSTSLLSNKNEATQSHFMYEGDWHRGKEHGQGEYMTGDRDVIYGGEFVDGVKQGFGSYYFPNGDTYTGDFREGLRHGKGVYTLANNVGAYDGDWRDDKRHGRGVFTWFNDDDEVIDGKLFQSTYNGDWENNQRHGRGVLLLTNGFYYDGHWDRGVMEGRGECIYPIPETSRGGPGGALGLGSPLPPTPSRSSSSSPSPRASPKSPKRTSSSSSLSAKEKGSMADEEVPIVQQLYQGSFKAGLRDGRGTVVFAEVSFLSLSCHVWSLCVIVWAMHPS